MVRTLTHMNTKQHPPEEPIAGATATNRFWMLLSPALPVGGFSYSHGLESAVAEGKIFDAQSTDDWIATLGERVLPTLELPLVARLLSAINKQDERSANDWNDTAHATRESAELLLEETEKGKALFRLFPSLDVVPMVTIPNPGFSAAYALACSHWQIPERQALQGFAWIWFEMLVAAAIKLVPLGHSDGQRLLLRFNEKLPVLAEQALLCTDNQIGASAFGLAMLSSAHESQPARLFRS